MTTTAAEAETQVPDEATGGTSEEAISDSEAKGTTDESVTVRSEQEGESTPEPEPEDLLYSESSLAAARDAAREEGRSTALREREETTRDRRKQLATAIGERAGPSPVINSVRQALQNLSSELTDSDMEPVLKAVRDSRNTIEEAAFIIAASGYEAAINATFENEADSKAFWEKAAGLDPALDASTVLPLYAEHRAMQSRAIKEADPEDLIKANPRLKEHLAKYGDGRYKAGREQGRKDPKAEASTTGEAVAPARAGLTLQEATSLPIVELLRRRQGA